MLRLLDGCVNLYANRKVQTCQVWVMGNINADHIMIKVSLMVGVRKILYVKVTRWLC